MKIGGSRSRRPFFYAATTAVAAGLFVGCVVAALTAALVMPAEGLVTSTTHGLLAPIAGLIAGLGVGLYFGRASYRTEIELASAPAEGPPMPANDPAPPSAPRPVRRPKRAA
ncbi:MAG: hypothetical protein O3A96_12210 [Proteobacteria bacterium]|nr:hypothetical protein [Pseudomonadota bacterium]